MRWYEEGCPGDDEASDGCSDPGRGATCPSTRSQGFQLCQLVGGMTPSVQLVISPSRLGTASGNTWMSTGVSSFPVGAVTSCWPAARC